MLAPGERVRAWCVSLESCNEPNACSSWASADSSIRRFPDFGEPARLEPCSCPDIYILVNKLNDYEIICLVEDRVLDVNELGKYILINRAKRLKGMLDRDSGLWHVEGIYHYIVYLHCIR